MKKQVVLLVIAITSLFACTRHKVAGVNLNGRWVVNNVRLDGAGNSSNYKITLFNDISSTCLQGSEWFLTESGNATYTITESSDCTGGARPIHWSTSKSGDVQYFQFKSIDGVKARKNPDGYRLELSNVSKEGFTLREPVQVGNQNAYVVLDFVKK